MTTDNNTPLFTQHDAETAPPASQDALRAIANGGHLPHLLGFMAESPQLLNGYVELYARFAKSSLDARQQQIVLLTVSAENECHYCTAAHTPVARQAGLSAGAVNALRDSRPLQDSKDEALREFVQAVVISRAFLPHDAVPAFLAAGYTVANVLDVVLGVAVKTMSNYTNHLIDTPLDPASKPHAWTPPSVRAAA